MAHGRATTEARIAAGTAVTPLGLDRSLDELRKYKELEEANQFGRSEEIRCPHYVEETGGCGVWRHRNGVCATWHCHHERGALGVSFWMHLRRLFERVEVVLVRHCLLELGLDEYALSLLFPAQGALSRNQTPKQLSSPNASPDLRRAAWGSYAGREIELFKACAEIVDALTWDDVLKLGGADLRLAWQLTRAAQRDMQQNDLAPLVELVANKMKLGGDQAEIVGAAPYRTFSVDAQLAQAFVPALMMLPGYQSKEQVIAAIEGQVGPLSDEQKAQLLESGMVRKVTTTLLPIPMRKPYE
jgi:hypothetical protein